MLALILKIMLVVVVILSASMIGVTLALNTKSEGLGAAITGASDSYRGAVGVEEQKRNLLKNLCYWFLGASLVYGVLAQFVTGA